MKKTIGIFAHVDAGKTTLSELLLYKTKAIRRAGRVDDQNTTLDYDETERRRGITVFADMATFFYGKNQYYLVDTPGHVDFSPQTERAISVIDYAILLISATDGVQTHTKTLWSLLERAGKPVFIFINKADMPTADQTGCLSGLCKAFGSCVDFNTDSSEELALLDEALLEDYMENPRDLRRHERVRKLIGQRRLFPCFYGSALQDLGVDFFLESLDALTETEYDPEAPLAAQVFKVRHQADGGRVCFLKILSGRLQVKDSLTIRKSLQKINELRFYTGAKYQPAQEAVAGDVCGVLGLSGLQAGDRLGAGGRGLQPVMTPAVMCAVHFDSSVSSREVLRVFRILEDEEPTLSVCWNEELGDLQIHSMGDIQLEILADEIHRRFGLQVTFGDCKILYRETISAPVYGFGHFEPLRHYAEVHLKLEPLPRGSGIVFESALPTDVLPRSYQNLIETHIFETQHPGPLTGSPITDIRITLINGKAHEKHTSGGDFREATYRAIRQALFSAEPLLLEPVYAFEADAPAELTGKILSDMQRMSGQVEPPEQTAGGVHLAGWVPVSEALAYPASLASETGGRVRLALRPAGYRPCHNSETVIETIGYERERDLARPAGSVFVRHGSTITVPWHEMHTAIDLEKPPAL
ncbi:MAG: GTP-binding protein [Clostridia bacterium]